MSSLEEVRANIDRLDREIIGLMAERGIFVQQAARFKSSHADVEAPQRVEQVVVKVRDLAIRAGLEPRVAEAAYRANDLGIHRSRACGFSVEGER